MLTALPIRWGSIFCARFFFKLCWGPHPRRVSRATVLYLAALDGAACRVSAHSGRDPWRCGTLSDMTLSKFLASVKAVPSEAVRVPRRGHCIKGRRSLNDEPD